MRKQHDSSLTARGQPSLCEMRRTARQGMERITFGAVRVLRPQVGQGAAAEEDLHDGRVQ